MEKTIILFWLLLACSCSETAKEDSSEREGKGKVQQAAPTGFCSNLSEQKKQAALSDTEVHWMYMDDSLKDVCRPLNFRMPWMMSDIKTIPDMITPEILKLSPVRTFEIVEKTKGFVDDSLHYFYFGLERDFCFCEVYRFYRGTASDKDFTGYEITEQIICNARSGISGLSTSASAGPDAMEEENSKKYEKKGHEH